MKIHCFFNSTCLHKEPRKIIYAYTAQSLPQFDSFSEVRDCLIDASHFAQIFVGHAEHPINFSGKFRIRVLTCLGNGSHLRFELQYAFPILQRRELKEGGSVRRRQWQLRLWHRRDHWFMISRPSAFLSIVPVYESVYLASAVQ